MRSITEQLAIPKAEWLARKVAGASQIKPREKLGSSIFLISILIIVLAGGAFQLYKKHKFSELKNYEKGDTNN